jgi:carbamoyltransferase
MLARTALGIHIGHDRGAALVRDGRLVAQLAEERLDRVKHSNSPELPAKSIAAVLKVAGLQPSAVSTIGISYTNVIIGNIIDQLAAEIRDLLSVPAIPIHGFAHHDCHAWSTYCTAGVKRALILVADGSGDIAAGDRLEAESFYVGERGCIHLLERRLQDFGLTHSTRRNAFNLAYMSERDRAKQISIGRKYEQFTYLLGFGHGQAGKTMALAAYAPPLFTVDAPTWRGLDFSLTFEDGLAELDRLWQASGEPWHRYVRQHAAAIAATAQHLLESYVEHIVRTSEVAAHDGMLCAAGGVFLSCRLNHRILTRTPVRSLHVIPAAGDDGQCVGAAFAAYAAEFGAPESSSSALPYLGLSHSIDEIAERIAYFNLAAEQLPDAELARRLATDLAAGRVVGLVRGRSELGPRALCHRSLLADPRRPEMRDRLNFLKGRELFRPFAPVVTADDQFRYFELVQTSPYMLLAAAVREQFRPALPAITHVDGTARVQAVTARDEPFLHSLLRAFETLTTHPVLLNTSFNLAGDPIVESPHDALVAFQESRIDVLALESFYIAKGQSTAERHQKTGVKYPVAAG